MNLKGNNCQKARRLLQQSHQQLTYIPGLGAILASHPSNNSSRAVQSSCFLGAETELAGRGPLLGQAGVVG
jgi:hypothetical protein